MTREELVLFMDAHRMHDAELAQVLGVTVGAVAHWRLGRRKIPKVIARLVTWFTFHPEQMENFRSMVK